MNREVVRRVAAVPFNVWDGALAFAARIAATSRESTSSDRRCVGVVARARICGSSGNGFAAADGLAAAVVAGLGLAPVTAVFDVAEPPLQPAARMSKASRSAVLTADETLAKPI